jgi:hypothetical protein
MLIKCGFCYATRSLYFRLEEVKAKYQTDFKAWEKKIAKDGR